MVEPIRIELETEIDGRELIDTLARHGLVGRLLYTGSRFEVELHSPREETRRLLLELEPALELWLADRGRASISLHVGARSRLVRRERPSSNELPGGSPRVRILSRETGEKGEIHGNDRQMEPVA